MKEKTCKVCGVGFQAKRRDAKTCSAACRKTYQRWCDRISAEQAEAERNAAEKRKRGESMVIETLADRAQETAPECDAA